MTVKLCKQFWVWACLIIVLLLDDFVLFVLLVAFPALHLAVMQGRLNNVRALLTESNIDAEAFNLRYARIVDVVVCFALLF